MRIVAGVDGGATYTRVALVTTSGNVLGIGTAGPSNYGSVSKSKIKKHIEKALQGAYEQAEISTQKLEAVFLGLAGIVSSTDQQVIQNLIQDSHIVHADEIEVDHDIRISLAGGLAGREGVALIVGTGSSCYGRRNDGLDWMAGGWGHFLDDQGSAYDLGHRGLMAVVRAADGRGPQTAMTELLMQKLNIHRIEEIIHRIHVEGPSGRPMDKKEIAALATLITEAAEAGDNVANRIIEKGIHELVLMVKTVVDQLNFNSRPVSLVISGGTFEGSSLIKNKLCEELTDCIPGIKIETPKLTPLEGSVLLALKSIGVENSDDVIDKIAASYSPDQDEL